MVKSIIVLRTVTDTGDNNAPWPVLRKQQ